ncbi:MAG: hypothetical protein Q8R34_00605 [bacterium]|nr:hypothetical protein [bacterium]
MCYNKEVEMHFFRKIIFYSVTAVLAIPLFVYPELYRGVFIQSAEAASVTNGVSQPFSISKDYEFSGKSKINATLKMEGQRAKYFVEDNYWSNRSSFEQQEILQQINRLADEFDSRIYPVETDFWGSESNPGIDQDPKVIILLADLIDTAGGYYDTSHQFSKVQVPESNEKDLIYLNIRSLRNERKAFNFLAHEFQHLIAFNQKTILRQLEDDIWLNELRSEYSLTLLGYNDIYPGSNLKARVAAFLSEPNDSLTEWSNKAGDYGQVTIFGEYLVEHFGSNILKKSFHSELSGTISIDQALQDNGYTLGFEDIFLRWSVANAINDILLGSDYGYFRDGLRQELRIPATRTISGLSENAVFSMTEAFKDWQQKWIWIMDISRGIKNVLKINFNGEKEDFFRGAAILFNQNGTREVQFFDLSKSGPDNLFFDLGRGLEKIILIPVKMEKIRDFTDKELLSDLTISFERISEMPTVSASPLPSIETNPIETKLPVSAVHPADFGLQEGDFIRAEGDNDVYIINDFGFKRLVLSPQICLLYGHLGERGCFAAVKVVSAKVRDAFQTSLFFTDGENKDGRVYFLELTGEDSALLRFVNMSGEDFVNQGGNFSSIFIFNTREKNTYLLGAEINNLPI